MKSNKKKLLKMRKKKKKDWQHGKNMARRVLNVWRNHARIFDKIGSPIVTHYTQD
jgi:hypothetical protein